MKETHEDKHDVGQTSGAGNRIIFDVHYTVPEFDRFFRSQPAYLEGPAARWEAVRKVIDFGGWLLELGPPLSSQRAIRDAVLLALLRRALVTAEGIRVLLGSGLEEPAIAATRTLLDIELAVKLVTIDPSNRMAERLAAWHYYGSQKHGQRMLAHSDTRATLAKEDGGSQRTIDIARSYAAFLERPVFDEVRNDLRQSGMWHGYKNVESAFEAAGAVSDYHILYDLGTFFVHDTNVDYDYAEVRQRADGGQEFVLKPLVQRDPVNIRAPLGNMVVRLHSILSMYVQDRGLEERIERAGAEMERSSPPPSPEFDSTRLSTMEGLMTIVLEHFGDLGPTDNFQIATDSPASEDGQQ